MEIDYRILFAVVLCIAILLSLVSLIITVASITSIDKTKCECEEKKDNTMNYMKSNMGIQLAGLASVSLLLPLMTFLPLY